MIGQVVGGRYEIMRHIGKGGMGSIYEVRNTRLGRSFALKTLSAEAAEQAEMLARFRREADLVAKLKHPNIVEVIDWEELADGSPCIIMEYLQGEDLAARIEGTQLAWPAIARIGDQILAALSVAHAANIVHRDLKPQNVFLANDGSGEERVKLLDFGVSKIRDSQSMLTTDARLLGTPAYMSPEQAEGNQEAVGSATDIWAVGAILYEMATGALAFDGTSLPSILYRICQRDADPVDARRPDAPAAFVALVREMLTREVDARIADADVARVRLRETLRDVDGVRYSSELVAQRGSRPSTSGRRKRLTDALTDTIQGGESGVRAPAADVNPTPAPTPWPTPLPTLARRKASPLVAVVGLVAVAAVVVAIVLAARGRARSAVAAPLPLTQPVPVRQDDLVPPVDAGTPVVELPDAALAVPTRPVRPPKKPDPVRLDPKLPTPTPPKQDPPKPDPSKLAPVKQPCAKDDDLCNYGTDN